MYFQIEEIEDNPGYIYFKKCSLTKLDLINSAYDRLVNTLYNENGYLSGQKLNKILYETVKACEKETKRYVDLLLLPVGLQSLKKACDYPWFETENDEYPNIIIRFEGFRMFAMDMLAGAFNCIYSKDRLKTWAKMQRPHGWSSSSVIDQVLEMPVHIVPKGCKGSENRALEFRISYVLGEIMLMKSLNDTQSKLCILLKLLVKSTVDTSFPDIITSYCLKNVVFWICERNPKTMFDNGSLLELLESSLEFNMKIGTDNGRTSL